MSAAQEAGADFTSGYDLTATIGVDFLNRAILFAAASGKLPTSFSTVSAFAMNDVGFRGAATLALKIDHVRLFCRPAYPRRLAAEILFSGTCELLAILEELSASPIPALRNEPAVNRKFSIGFSGRLQADAQIVPVPAEDGQTLQVSFAGLDQLDVIQIGSLSPGHDFSEVLRRLTERVGLIELSTRFRLPNMTGFAGSALFPWKEVLPLPAGQIGLVDFRSTKGEAGISDQVHILLQSGLNPGKGNFQAVSSTGPAGSDLNVAVGYRFLRQLLQDLWTGGAIPRRFNDQGIFDAAGKNTVTRVDLVTYQDLLGLKASLQRRILGLDVNVDVNAAFGLGVTGKSLSVEVRQIDFTVDLAWARSVGMGMIFVVLWELVFRVLGLAIGIAADKLAPASLQKMLDSRRLPLEWKGNWGKSPFAFDVQLQHVAIGPDGILLSAGVGLGL
jgi:hypothetical protein